ncbi:hypothetical protein PoB_002279000 [Plakobranchus ocellatus]|uniref:Uncharacterized protein n=1 Tax=Plakobranchus ocellatus TaxID=259542 RepID=A0AAV3ZMC5_9GAST|nr:hypothetical protein PoB_002279000 [Plakobranchus ocellatus]
MNCNGNDNRSRGMVAVYSERTDSGNDGYNKGTGDHIGDSSGGGDGVVVVIMVRIIIVMVAVNAGGWVGDDVSESGNGNSSGKYDGWVVVMVVVMIPGKRANFGIFVAYSVLAFYRHPEKQLYRYSITMLTDGTAHDHRAVNIVTRSGIISFLQRLLLVRSISGECDGQYKGQSALTGLSKVYTDVHGTLCDNKSFEDAGETGNKRLAFDYKEYNQRFCIVNLSYSLI